MFVMSKGDNLLNTATIITNLRTYQVTFDFYSHGDAHARGRFTRNFVVQATASEWALCLLADLRRRLAEDPDGELVFFQHDEVVVHTRNPESGAAHVLAAAASATRLLFGDTVVRFPMDVAARETYGKGTS